MIRPLHRWVGLAAALFVCVTALSGGVLALYPAAEAIGTMAAPPTDVGSFAALVQDTVPGLEQIRRAPSGQITAFAYDGGVASKWIVDPETGVPTSPVTQSPTKIWITDLHRAFLAGDAGRIATAVVSLAMLVLSVSGFMLAARRIGGWRRLFAPLKGSLPQRLHLEVARFAGIGLLLSSLTGLWLFAATFGLLPGGAALPALPPVSGSGSASPAALSALKDIPLSHLRELSFPRIDNLRDVYTIKTVDGMGYVDQGTGAMLSWSARTPLQQLSDFIKMLHTGKGAAVLGLILGLCAACVPILAMTGLLQQSGRFSPSSFNKRRTSPKDADTVILVGSEGGTTWTFAQTLSKALAQAGGKPVVAAMSDFTPERYDHVARYLILAATSGDGDAPSSADGFLDRLASMQHPPTAPFAVLGFGDSTFPRYCAYADSVAAEARKAGWRELMPAAHVDRQSRQDFTSWGEALAEKLGVALSLDSKNTEARAVTLPLLSRRDYGEEVQAPTAILRFALPRIPLCSRLMGHGFARFQAGDLIGIIPEGDTVPRYYSLASGRRDGFIEICVRKQAGGLCSGQLMELRPGGTVKAFLRRNPGFYPVDDRSPLILIGAGTGIGPLAGFVRANTARRPMHLYFGARSQTSDLLYGEDFGRWQAEGRLSSLVTAFSRSAEHAYVQDLLRRDADVIRQLIGTGARIMICGGRGMAAGVAAAMEDILSPLSLSPITLKAEGRYVEDVY
ncbi:sulfite reductase (NADPH) flavoprotein alpha-component [Breoghania corrubedonensis]|uniref:NADPH--hemoprotein reductase n=1 Tax=Breoghania corrubedonensis TaxID=665038 RepID=A0A2T5US43_9HYPH|nr:PepSY domain-containing protein [Breoghania corrubedonensis]PTW54326.1 sulfite reductase (NADPH) flavoprotein alpha-component [Breoghania corrubedonensis]